VNATASVEFRGVWRRYGLVTAVENLSFTIGNGQLVTLLGPSGCGKTTTLRMIAGLESPSEGSIHIGGEDVTRLAPNERDVSMVFQSYALFPHMTVAENVGYGLVPGKLPKAEQCQRVEAALRGVGLEGFGARLPSQLSGGQQQRVAVARALVLEPRVMLFDEPLSNLDAKLRRHMRDEIRDLQRKLNLTAVYVTHDQEEAMAVSDRIILLNHGRIAQEGSPADLYERPADAFVADFIGGANLVPCEVLATSGLTARVRLGGREQDITVSGLRPDARTLAIRYWALVPGAAEGAALHGRVRKATYLGSHSEYTVQTDAGDLFVTDHQGHTPCREGEAVGLHFRGGGLALV
jgi:iron(III) transport system ATP-binding protein